MRKGIIFLIAIFLIGIVSAEIKISEPLDIYNLGDRIYVDVSGIRGADSGNLNIDLVCSNNSINLVRISARAFSKEEEQEYEIPYKVLNKEDLEISNLSQIVGNCQIKASLGQLSSATKVFRISRDVRVSAKLNKLRFNPGEQMILEVSAIKANGKPLNGFVEVSNATKISKAIKEGNLKEIFSMPKTSEAGEYLLNIRAYEANGDEVLNEGSTTLKFIVNQVASFVKTSISSEKATPGEKFKIGAQVFDQSGKEMPGSVMVRIVSPKDEITEMTIDSGKFKEIEFPLNATAGEWKIIASFDKVQDSRKFEMKRIQKAKFYFEDDSILAIKNIGNSLYNRTINLKIGTEMRTLHLRIKEGEVRKFNLKAPNGEYEVVVDDGVENLKKNVLLTGSAISIDDLGDNGIFSLGSLIIILAIIAAGIGAYFLIRYKRTRKVGIAAKSDKKEDMVDMTKKEEGSAEKSLVVNGGKYPSSVLAIRLKNFEDLNENSLEEFRSIVRETSTPKGLIDWRREYTFIVFSPIITKTYANEIIAIRTASKIVERLKAHNKKFNNKILFGIGINSGDLVTAREGKKLKYTSIGNTISLAKKLSDMADEKILISEEVRKKAIREARVEKAGNLNNKTIYSVKEIKNVEASQEKLKELLRRMNRKSE
ncbi:hypothetical protein D6829_01395 [Candidatus Pacearchaeota archaeon]|nr:MAG: hypothetical protein D6829_01395 [Candidatus Pacearchaeota archaeon]